MRVVVEADEVEFALVSAEERSRNWYLNVGAAVAAAVVVTVAVATVAVAAAVTHVTCAWEKEEVFAEVNTKVVAAASMGAVAIVQVATEHPSLVHSTKHFKKYNTLPTKFLKE